MLRSIFALENGPFQVHHGDAIGGDASAHDIAREFDAEIHIHPPINPKYQAFCQGDVNYPAKDYLVRDLDIVIACDLLIGMPNSYTEKLRSGTWATIRRARKTSTDHVIIYPNGKLEYITY